MAALLGQFGIEHAEWPDAAGALRPVVGMLRSNLFLGEFDACAVELAELADQPVVAVAVESFQVRPGGEQGVAQHDAIGAVEGR